MFNFNSIKKRTKPDNYRPEDLIVKIFKHYSEDIYIYLTIFYYGIPNGFVEEKSSIASAAISIVSLSAKGVTIS